MTPELAKELKAFDINTCRTLSSTGVDAVHEILPMIHGLSVLLDFGMRKGPGGESALDNANPDLVASAFAGIAYLSALAMFHAGDV